jgi:spiro-SPASM protein
VRIIAAVFADFEHSFLGLPSQLSRRLGSRTVLEHTLDRLARVSGLDGRCLFVRPRDREPARQALQQSGHAGGTELVPLDDGQRRRRALLRSARKWNLHAWRGSPLGTTWFDEFVEPPAVARVLNHYGCDAVLCLDGHQPAFDTGIASAMVARMRERADQAALVFSQAPPGLAGLVLTREAVAQLLAQDIPAGLLLSYRPEMPRCDPINQPSCFQIDTDIARTVARFTADTRRSRELLEPAFAQLGEQVESGPLCAFIRNGHQTRPRELPAEIEVELTTETPLPESTLRPPCVPTRELSDLETLDRLADQLAAYDDQLVTFGGHGDPLAHPDFAQACERFRKAGVLGITVRTPLVNLSDECLEALFANHVDILQVRLDADSPELYRGVHAADRFDRVIANIERVQCLRRERVSAQPIVVPSFTRCTATLHEMEEFFDRWIRATGWAVIDGYNDYCGALPPDSLLHAAPPVRQACRRLNASFALLADGTTTMCHQDYRGQLALGDWRVKPLTELWSSDEITRARRAHAALELDNYPLCQQCHEWFRP